MVNINYVNQTEGRETKGDYRGKDRGIMYTLFVYYITMIRLLYIALYPLNTHCYLQHIVLYNRKLSRYNKPMLSLVLPYPL